MDLSHASVATSSSSCVADNRAKCSPSQPSARIAAPAIRKVGTEEGFLGAAQARHYDPLAAPRRMLIRTPTGALSGKEKGRSRYEVFGPNIPHVTASAAPSRAAARHRGDELSPVYQPIVASNTDRFHRTEALIRWQPRRRLWRRAAASTRRGIWSLIDRHVTSRSGQDARGRTTGAGDLGGSINVCGDTRPAAFPPLVRDASIRRRSTPYGHPRDHRDTLIYDDPRTLRH